MTKIHEILKQKLDRLKTAKSWQKRINKLKKRKENPLDEKAFCHKHSIPHFRFNRQKNGHSVPNKKSIERVEEAFQKEGV